MYLQTCYFLKRVRLIKINQKKQNFQQMTLNMLKLLNHMKIESRPTLLGAAVEKCVVLIVLREVRSILKRVSVKLEARKR